MPKAHIATEDAPLKQVSLQESNVVDLATDVDEEKFKDFTTFKLTDFFEF